MAKTLLGIVASPRKYGNSELFVKELYRQLGTGWELQLIRLPELNIGSCRACYQCLFGNKQCPQEDDFVMVLQALAAADAYVVAAPTYLLAANASLKQFLDRGLSFYAHLDKLWGKPAVGAAIAGIEGLEGAAKLDVDRFIKLTWGDHRGSEVIYAALPGEILLSQAGKAAAERLAGNLLHGPSSQQAANPTCPLCGGDTFRFLPDGGVRCMLCSSAGHYQWRDNHLHIGMDPGAHPLFLSYADAKRHADWLRGMKDNFLARRQELKEVSRDYASIGAWVRPAEKPGKGQ